MGDSSATGPGAGEAYDKFPDPDDCFRSKGAYSPQLAKHLPFPAEDLQFLACTGDVVDNLVNVRLPIMDPDQQVVTLSIGGNDIKFSKVLKACVLKPAGPASDDCKTTIKEAYEIINNNLRDTLNNAYDYVFAFLDRDYKRKVIVLFYPHFSPPMILGATIIRNKMKSTVDDYVRERISLKKLENRLSYNDADDTKTYTGHGFYEAGKQTFDDEDIWFFKVNGNDSPNTGGVTSGLAKAYHITEQYDASTFRRRCVDFL